MVCVHRERLRKAWRLPATNSSVVVVSCGCLAGPGLRLDLDGTAPDGLQSRTTQQSCRKIRARNEAGIHHQPGYREVARKRQQIARPAPCLHCGTEEPFAPSPARTCRPRPCLACASDRRCHGSAARHDRSGNWFGSCVSLSPLCGLSYRRRLIGVLSDRVPAHPGDVGNSVLGQAGLLGQHHRQIDAALPIERQRTRLHEVFDQISVGGRAQRHGTPEALHVALDVAERMAGECKHQDVDPTGKRA